MINCKEMYILGYPILFIFLISLGFILILFPLSCTIKNTINNNCTTNYIIKYVFGVIFMNIGIILCIFGEYIKSINDDELRYNYLINDYNDDDNDDYDN